MNSPERPVYTVSALTAELKTFFNQAYGDVWVEGEVSGFKASPSGHAYFNLKDDDALLSAVLWRSTLARMRERPQNGQMIRAHGNLDLYPPRGNYQLIVDRVVAAGEGALARRFEELKKRLAAEGLFDEDKKRPVPATPGRVGLITSPRGAAIRDFLSVVRNRYRGLSIQLIPVAVQGKAAAGEIAAAIGLFNRLREVDVIVVTRGGGSMEDLWAFNEEETVRAVYASEIPIISAVGHEIDFSLCDFAADLRVPTPTAAGQYVTARHAALRDALRAQCARLERSLCSCIELRRERLERLRGGIEMRSPLHRVALLRQGVDRQLSRSIEAVSRNVETRRGRLSLLSQHVVADARRNLLQRRHRLEVLRERLLAMNPRDVLARGYAIAVDEETGRVLRAPAETAPGRRLRVELSQGELRARVE